MDICACMCGPRGKGSWGYYPRDDHHAISTYKKTRDASKTPFSLRDKASRNNDMISPREPPTTDHWFLSLISRILETHAFREKGSRGIDQTHVVLLC